MTNIKSKLLAFIREKQIEQFVYQLYNLTADEINIIENI
jgi:hypothetical protein